MGVDEEVARYFPAAQISAIPDDLSKPRHILTVTSAEQRRKQQERCTVMTEIWNAADSDSGRRAALYEYAGRADADQHAIDRLESFLRGPLNRLPLAEIEFAMDHLGLTDEDNGVISRAERESLDGDGYVNLGQLLDADQLQKMRDRYDAATRTCGIAARRTARASYAVRNTRSLGVQRSHHRLMCPQ